MSWASLAPYIFEGVKLGAQYGAAEMSSRDKKKWEKKQRAAERRANLINVASGGRTNVRPEYTEFQPGKGARLFGGLAQGAGIAQTVNQLNDARKLRKSQLTTQKLQQESLERAAEIESGAAMAAGDWDKFGPAGIMPGEGGDTPWLSPSGAPTSPAAATTTPDIIPSTTPTTRPPPATTFGSTEPASNWADLASRADSSWTARPEELLEMPAPLELPASLTQRPPSASRGAPVTTPAATPAAKPVAAPITGLGTSDRPLQLSDNVARGDVDLRGLGLSQLDRTAPTTPQELSNVDRLAADRTALASTQPPGGAQFPSGYSPEASARRLRDVSRTDIPAALQGRGGLDLPSEPRLLAGASDATPGAEMPTLEKVATDKLAKDFDAPSWSPDETDEFIDAQGRRTSEPPYAPIMGVRGGPETVVEAKADAPTRTNWEQLGYTRQSLVLLKHAADTQDDVKMQAIVAAKAVMDDPDLFIDMTSAERTEVWMGLAAHGKSEGFIRKFMQDLPLQAASAVERKDMSEAGAAIDEFMSIRAKVEEYGDSDIIGFGDQPRLTWNDATLARATEIESRLKVLSMSIAKSAGQGRLSDFDMRFFGEIAGEQSDRWGALQGKFTALEEILRLGSKKMLSRFEGGRVGMMHMPESVTQVGEMAYNEEFPTAASNWAADPRWKRGS
jgi:hypothetical protein